MDTASDTDNGFLPSSDILQARLIALEILSSVLDRKSPLDQVLDDHKTLHLLDPRDRGFARLLVFTTLRRLGQIDDLIRQAIERPDQKIQPVSLHHLLRLGVAQLVFLDTAPHAAVSTSVDMAQKLGLSKMKGFVNAVLRKISYNGKEWTTRQDIARLNLPDWLLQSWIKDWGLSKALDSTAAILREPPLDITIKAGNDLGAWAEKLDGEVMPFGTVRKRNEGAITSLPGFSGGDWWIQEASASLPAKLLHIELGDRVLDMCAAPGGKTAQMASAGASVVAIDRSAKRMQTLKENMQRLGLAEAVECVIADASTYRPQNNEKFSKILLDAPCTATGTIRRQPDMPWLKDAEDVERLSSVQARLLDAAYELLAPGGTLVYCTCSLQQREGEIQVGDFLKNHPDMRLVPVSADAVPGLEMAVTDHGVLRIFPHYMEDRGGVDGFFAARLRKALS